MSDKKDIKSNSRRKILIAGGIITAGQVTPREWVASAIDSIVPSAHAQVTPAPTMAPTPFGAPTPAPTMAPTPFGAPTPAPTMAPTPFGAPTPAPTQPPPPTPAPTAPPTTRAPTTPSSSRGIIPPIVDLILDD